MHTDAVALLELRGVASGYAVLDTMTKHSPVQIIEANLVEPGHFLILYTGGVAEVEEAHNKAQEHHKQKILAQMLLPFAHVQILKALSGAENLQTAEEYDCLGVVECKRIADTLRVADAVLKNADVTLVGLRVATALGGKGYFVLSGLQHDVEIALDIVGNTLKPEDIVDRELIPRPHVEAVEWLLRKAPFHVGR